ncbi:MAG: Fic family protein [Archaeoglobaceae archaeon]
MSRLEIKQIKGRKYVYIRDKFKVNGRTEDVTLYVGPLGKITYEKFIHKVGELFTIRLTSFTDYWLSKYVKYLDREKAFDIELLHLSYRLFRSYYPDEVKSYERYVFVRYVQGTTSIEGNTINQRQAEQLLEHGLTPAGKSLREVYEIANFKNLDDYLKNYRGDITESSIKKIHEILMQNVLESPGEYCRVQVLIEKAEHEPPPALDVPHLMKNLIKWYDTNKGKLHPFELAVLLHTRFVTIHPFADGNGRVARALMNFILNRNSYPTLYIGMEDREAYLDAVAEGNKEDYNPIIDFMYRLYTEQHRLIRDEIHGKIKRGDIEEFPESQELIEQFNGLRIKK